MARVAGVIGSFTLAMDNVARFHTRGMLIQVAEVSRKFGWRGNCVITEKVVEKVMF